VVELLAAFFSRVGKEVLGELKHVIGLETIMNTALIDTLPIRIKEHDITVVVVWRIPTHAFIIIVPTMELLTARIYCTR